MVQSMGLSRMKPGGSRPSKPQFPPPHEGLVRPETVGRRARQQQGRDGEELLKKMVPRKGLEPSRPLSHWHLKPARLPIPPPGPKTGY